METASPPASTATDAIESLGLVPVVELDTADKALALLDALTEGGLPIAEITFRTDAALEAIALLRGSRPDALVGAGTVRTLEAAREAIEAGARFVVSPSTNVEVIELCTERNTPVVPGVCTPTEIDTAVRAGASIMKLFPAEALGGTAFLKALLGPFRDVRFVPTGGVNASNLADYIRIPQVLACGGSWIVAPRLVREGRFDEVTRLTREAVSIIAGARKRGDDA